MVWKTPILTSIYDRPLQANHLLHIEYMSVYGLYSQFIKTMFIPIYNIWRIYIHPMTLWSLYDFFCEVLLLRNHAGLYNLPETESKKKNPKITLYDFFNIVFVNYCV